MARKPTVGGDRNAWGTILNEKLDEIDASVARVDPGTDLVEGDIIVGGVGGGPDRFAAGGQGKIVIGGETGFVTALRSPSNTDGYTIAANMPAGAPTLMSETGQEVRTFGNGATWSVSGDELVTTHAAASDGAAYLQSSIGDAGDVHRVFGVVNAGASDTAQLALVIPSSEWRAGGTGPLTAAGVHYVVSPSSGSWHIDYWDGSAIDTYASGTIDPWNDGEDRYAEVSVDPVTSTATIIHPDGTTTSVTDARIAANISSFGIIESYSTTGTAPSFVIKQFGLAAAAPSERDPFINRANLASFAESHKRTVTVLTDTVTGTYVAPTTAAAVDAGVVRTSFLAPPSGQALVTVEGFVDSTDATQHYLWALIVATGSLTSVSGHELRRVLLGQYRGVLQHTFVLTDMTPGKVLYLDLRHMSTVSSAVTLRIGGTNVYPFSFVVTPFE